MKLSEVSKEELKIVLENSKSMREVILKFGLSANGSGGYRNVKKRIIDLGLQIPKYNYYGDPITKYKRLSNDVVFCKNSTYPRQKLKNRIIKQTLIDYICSECGNVGYHMNKPLSLHLDHINGINDDNRITNLRFLCPNCHSQTDTYAGKANKRP